MLIRYVTDILKMCMKKFKGEKIIFDKFTGFGYAHCGGYTVSLACSQFLVVLKFSRSLYLGNHLPESIHTWTIGTQ